MHTIKKFTYSKLLVCLSAILSIFITYTHAHSLTMAYGGAELALAFFCYLLFLFSIKRVDKFIASVYIILTIISFLNSILFSDIKSAVLLSLSLIVPIAISTLNIEFSKNGKEFCYGFLIGFLVIVGQFFLKILGLINSNTFGFYCYMAISVGFIWYKTATKKKIPIILLITAGFLAIGSGSRNVAIVLLLMLVLLFLPNRVYENKTAFRIIYIVTIIYTIFAANILEWIFKQEKISSFLIKYTESVSDKDWGMEARVGFLREVRSKIFNLGVFEKLFGSGVLKRHGHNLFYQSVFIYGYIGTFFLYIVYIRIFEKAYTLIKNDKDKIALGCFIGLIGAFLLNGGDLFLIGTETCAIIPQLLMGIILLRHRQYKIRKKIEPVIKGD